MASSSVGLYPYQQRWVADQSRWKVGMLARQTGKTFASTLEIVMDCLEGRRRWVILSRGERQAKEAMTEGVQRHLAALKVAFEAVDYPVRADINALEVRLENGSRITALPANPDTARGFSANVLLDEFAFHLDSRKIWAALFPVISAGHKLRVISTPNGKGNKFYELMTSDDPIWSKHRVDIYEAVAQGLPRDIEELRRALGDADAWAQEYELQWLDEATAWLDYGLISRCEDGLAGEPSQYQGGWCVVGWDVARRRDLSVIWVLERVGDVLWTREIVSMRRESFAVQREEFSRIMRQYRVMRACIDQTGMGEALVEELSGVWGLRVEGVLFSTPVKLDLASRLKRKFQDMTVRIPVDKEIRDSLHSVQKISTSAGNPRFDSRGDGSGHSDYFWALALALHGLEEAPPPDFSQVRLLGQGVGVSNSGWGVLGGESWQF